MSKNDFFVRDFIFTINRRKKPHKKFGAKGIIKAILEAINNFLAWKCFHKFYSLCRAVQNVSLARILEELEEQGAAKGRGRENSGR